MRLLFFFIVTAYVYAFKPGGVILMGTEFGTKKGQGVKSGWDDLKNSVVFTWGFVEMVLWFWVSFGEGLLMIVIIIFFFFFFSSG